MIEDKNPIEELERRIKKMMEEKQTKEYWDDDIALEDIEVMEDKDDMEEDMEIEEDLDPTSLKAIHLECKRTENELYYPIPTGFRKLDDILGGGLRKGNLYIFGGKPGIGKSTFCIQMMYQLMKQKNNVIYATAEMKARDIYFKLTHLAYVFNQRKEFELNSIVPILKELMNRKFEDEKHKEAKKVYDESTNNFINEFKSNIVYTKKTEEVEDVVKKYPNSILIIDYLQKMEPKKICQSDKQKVDEILEDLNELKGTYDVPIIAISSLNRSGYDREDKLAFFKESGGIEYDATGVFSLTKDEEDLNNKKLKIKCEKNRFDFGNTIVEFELKFYPKYELLEDI